MPREKSKYRDRRLSSSSSEASYERKKKSKHKRRSRSRDRSESSHKSKYSSSRSKHKRRSHSRSLSRDRYESKSRRRSTSRTRSKRDRSRSKSRSRYKSKKSSKRSHSRSRSSSYEIESRKVVDDTESKVEKAIKAANAVGLTLTKIPTYEYKPKEVKEDMPTIHDRDLLNELDNESFVQRTFKSSRSKKQNIVIDLNSETVVVPEGEVKVKKEDSVIDFNEIPNEEELKEMWIKKLYVYRKRMLKGEI